MQPSFLFPEVRNVPVLFPRGILLHESLLLRGDVPVLLPPVLSVRKNLPVPMHSSLLYRWSDFRQTLLLQEVLSHPDSLLHTPVHDNLYFLSHIFTLVKTFPKFIYTVLKNSAVIIFISAVYLSSSITESKKSVKI